MVFHDGRVDRHFRRGPNVSDEAMNSGESEAIERLRLEMVRLEEENALLRKQCQAATHELDQRDLMLAMQDEQLAELSTPVLPIANHALLMPLVGRIDETRARLLMERLLEGIVQFEALQVIVDLTGVSKIDENALTGLMNLTRAADLLGADVMLTGLRPELALAVVELNQDMSHLTICGTLSDGLRDRLGFGKSRFKPQWDSRH